MVFRRRKGGDAATVLEADGGPSASELLAEIDDLASRNREHRDADLERRILRLRHRAGAELVARSSDQPAHPAAASRPPGTNGSGLPQVAPAELTAELLRAAILERGCLLVRGLIDPDQAARLVEEIDRCFDAREACGQAGTDPDAYWQLFEPDPPFVLVERDWVSSTGSIWAADSPRVMFEMLDSFERAGLRQVIGDYLGERPAISVNKCTLRRVDASAGTAWHQDGAFLGDEVRALNVWLALSHCGDDAPGLDIVARRLDHVVPTGTEGAMFDWSTSQSVAEQAAGAAGIVRPIFEPGDVLLFDDLLLHRTGVEPEMPRTRYAIESWFFGPSGFPDDYAPIAF